MSTQAPPGPEASIDPTAPPPRSVFDEILADTVSAPPPRARPVDRGRRRPRPSFALVVALYALMLVSLLPLLRVIVPSAWTLAACAIAALLLGAGFIVRFARFPAYVATLVEVVLWLSAVTAACLPATAIAGIVPTPATIQAIDAFIPRAAQEIREGSAPLVAGPALSFVLVASIALLAIVIDHVAITARLPLLASIPLLTVLVAPSIIVPQETDAISVCLFAIVLAVVLRLDRRQRERANRPQPTGPSIVTGGSASALSLAAGALVITLVVAPTLPQTFASPGFGTGNLGTAINPSLDLGDDLRQPASTQVLRVWGDFTEAPYLRALTLSDFTGRAWKADTDFDTPISNGRVGETDYAPGVESLERSATVSVGNLLSPWLPVPFQTTAITGLEGDWRISTSDATISASDRGAGGTEATATYSRPIPTLEQIRAARTTAPLANLTQLDGNAQTIDEIAAIARDKTAGATNDYDRLIALQQWFRGSEFRYSLKAPVDDGFDGSGLDAVRTFLDVKSGYCVHFASAFAIMARTLDIPTRIVVGYLPGTPSGQSDEGKTIYSVKSTQLHAWPESYFEGIGWVPFEPTNSLGSPTTFSSGTAGGTSTSTPSPTATRAPSEAPAPSSSAAPGSAAETLTTPGALRPGVFWGPVGIVLLAIAIAGAPALVRSMRRRRRLAAAREGDAPAAWREILDTAADLGIVLPESASPREKGRRLMDAGAPARPTAVLVGAIEHASYAPGRGDGIVRGDDLGDAVTECIAGLREAQGSRAWTALVAPRSLLPRT